MEKENIAVLGGGLVGGFIAETLAADTSLAVTLYDHDAATLKRRALHNALKTRDVDLSSPRQVQQAVDDADLVIGALPGHLGYSALEAVLHAGKNTVDISFFPEDPYALAPLAEQKELTAVVDCGVMPGLGGLLAVHYAAQLAHCERVTIMVGGLPAERRLPLEYKAPFSPIDVIEEYTRPARLVENCKVVTRPALSDLEPVDLPGVGTLEAFNTDGLRTLLKNLSAPYMREKTLRYPGHAEKMRLLGQLGFFDSEPLLIDGQKVRPLDLSAALLIRQWKLEPGEQELTVMRVDVEGVDDSGMRVLQRADLLDRTDPATGALSMARTTGLPAVLAAKMLLAGQLPARGILPAELLGADDALCDILLDGLAEAGVDIKFEKLPR